MAAATTLTVFCDRKAADTWLQEHDPEGVAFEYDVLQMNRIGRRTILAMLLIVAIVLVKIVREGVEEL